MLSDSSMDDVLSLAIFSDDANDTNMFKARYQS